MTTARVGTPLIPFELESLAGDRVSLADYRGKKLLVSFLRNAQCALCNLWLATTARRSPGWRALGLEVVAVFESTPEKLRREIGRRAPPFAVLADPDGRWHDAYGSRVDQARVQAVAASPEAQAALARATEAGFSPRMEEGANFFRLPAEVLVDRDGVVARVHVMENVYDHLPPEVIDAFARDSIRAKALRS